MICVALLLLLSAPALAYVDPGLTGAIYQMGYLMIYGFLGVMMFFFRPIANFYRATKAKLFGQKPAAEPTPAETPADPPAEAAEQAPSA
ncbi:MAG: hypothetical protein AB1758_38250 [Candidatus Eremiobacterota bacterium]